MPLTNSPAAPSAERQSATLPPDSDLFGLAFLFLGLWFRVERLPGPRARAQRGSASLAPGGAHPATANARCDPAALSRAAAHDVGEVEGRVGGHSAVQGRVEQVTLHGARLLGAHVHICVPIASASGGAPDASSESPPE